MQMNCIEVLAGLIKRLAADHLHIVGDIFNVVHVQTGSPFLMQYHPWILSGEP